MLIAARSRPFLLLHRACGGAFSAYSYNNVRQSGWLSQEKSTLGHGIYNRKCENGSSERCILRRKVARPERRRKSDTWEQRAAMNLAKFGLQNECKDKKVYRKIADRARLLAAFVPESEWAEISWNCDEEDDREY